MVIENFGQWITMYSPILVTVLGYISTFFILIKKIKSFSFKKDTEQLETKVSKMLEENKKLRADNRELKRQLSIIIDKNVKIHNYEEIIENEKK